MAERDRLSPITLAVAKSFTSKSLIGLGALRGANAIVKDVVDVPEGKKLVFEWTATDGVTKETREVLLPVGAALNVVDALPTSGIDEHALYLYDGTLYQYDGSDWVEALKGGSGDSTEYEWSWNSIEKQIEVVDTAGNKQTLKLTGIGGGGGELTTDLPVALDVGGIKKSKTYPAGTSVEQIFNDLLNPVQNPTLTPPSATLSGIFPSMVKVGTEISAQTATVGLNRGRINPQYQATESYRSGAATGYALALSGASVTYSDNNNTGSFGVPAFTRNSKGNVTVTATASYGAGCQPTNSIGEPYESPLAAGSVSTTKTIQFVIPFKYGVVSDRTVIDLNSLTDDVSGKASKSYTFATNNEYMVVAYDSAHGELSEIIDPNNFDGTSGFEKVVMGDYFVYVSKSPTTDDSATYKFNF